MCASATARGSCTNGELRLDEGLRILVRFEPLRTPDVTIETDIVSRQHEWDRFAPRTNGHSEV